MTDIKFLCRTKHHASYGFDLQPTIEICFSQHCCFGSTQQMPLNHNALL